MSLSGIKKEFYNQKAHEYTKSIAPGSLYDKVSKFVGSNQNVLDVGCANASFSKELKKRKNKVIGIEISDVMAKKSKEYLDDVIVGDIEEMETLPWNKNYFNNILLMDILEHLFEPEKVLENIKPYLKKSGQIIVTIPNVANWEVRKNILFGRFNYAKSGIMDSGHIRFFTYNTAVKMFIKSGYSIRDEDCVMNLPSILAKLDNRFKFLNIASLCSNRYKTIFAFQFIFVLKRV